MNLCRTRLSASGATPSSLAELSVAALLLTLFVGHGKRLGGAALVDVSLFRHPAFSAAASVQFLSNAFAFGGQMLLPLFLLLVVRKSPSATGLLLVPAGLGALCSYPLMGALTERFGSRAVSASGAMLALLGTLPFALGSGSGLPMSILGAALFVRGMGMGSVNIPSVAVAYSAIPRALIPTATTSLNIAQRLGGPVATTGLAIFLHHSMQAHAADISEAFAATFWLLCAIHFAAVLAALRLPVRKEPVAE